MPEATSPQGTADDAALSFKEGVEDITNLLQDPDEPDLSEDDQGPDAEDDEQGEPGPDDGNAEDEEDADGSDEVAAGGKFVSRDAKVRLDDGTVISVGELARNNLFQRDYSRKTEEVKAEREAVHADRSKVNEVAQALVAQRDFLLQVIPQYAPQEPDMAMLDPNSDKFDPVGYPLQLAQFNKARETYGQLMQAKEAEQRRIEAEQAEAIKSQRAAEHTRLLEVVPEFKKPEVFRKFLSEANDVMVTKYGFSLDDLSTVTDHRMFRAIRDLVRLHKAAAQAPQVKEQLQRRPQIIKGGQRMDPKSKISREAKGRAERLAKTGTREAGIAALMDFDL